MSLPRVKLSTHSRRRNPKHSGKCTREPGQLEPLPFSENSWEAKAADKCRDWACFRQGLCEEA